MSAMADRFDMLTLRIQRHEPLQHRGGKGDAPGSRPSWLVASATLAKVAVRLIRVHRCSSVAKIVLERGGAGSEQTDEPPMNTDTSIRLQSERCKPSSRFQHPGGKVPR